MFPCFPNWFRCTEAANDDTRIVFCACGITSRNLSVIPECLSNVPHLYQFPDCLVSAASSALPTASPKPLQPSNLATGIGGENPSNTQGSQKNSWKESHKHRKQSWCHHSPPQCDKISSEKRGNMYSSTELSSPPYRMYLRPSGRTFGATRP